MISYKVRLQYQNFFATVVAYILMLTIHITSARAESPITIEPPTTSVLNSSSRNTFGEFCNSTVKCKAQSWLSCRPVTTLPDEPSYSECVCWDKDSMIYDKNDDKCVSKAGESCKFQVENPQDNTMTSLMTPCVSGARCHPVDGICMCDLKHYENTNGTCSVGQSVYKHCSPPSLQCSRHEGLHCNVTNDNERIRVCTCNETVSEYFFDMEKPEESQCVGLAEFPCINDKCVTNAKCNNVNDHKVCECESNSYKDDQRRCKIKKGFSETCSKNTECGILNDMQLLCIDGRCDCNTSISRYGTASKHRSPQPGFYSFDNFLGMESKLFTQCLGLVGLPCQNALCVPNAFCSLKSETCICQPDYTESNTRTCPSQYGGKCSHKGDCIDGLFCWEGICSCRLEDQNYDPITNTCHSRVNGPCNDVGGDSCIENAECTKFARPKIGVHQTNFGICECKPGFVESADGECEVRFGEPCSMLGSKCDTTANLKCIDNTCQCKTFSQYNEEQRACLISVGGKCKLADSMQSSCVKHATCVGKPNNTVGYGLYGDCKCDAGYEATRSYTCAPSSFGSDITSYGSSLRFVSRSEWLAQPPISHLKDLELPSQRIIIAHTATGNCSSQASCTFRVRYIQTFHTESKGLYDIGYNFLVGGDGSVYEGRGWDKEGIHTIAFTKRSICIAFIGTFNQLLPSDRQLIAAQKLIDQGVKSKNLIPNYQLYGQTQLIPSESPGAALYEIIKKWPHWSEQYIP